MRLVVDVNLPPRLAGRLRLSGHEVEHWSEIGKLNATDSEILTWAAENGAVILTCDLDFGAILAASRADSPSVIQIRARDILSDAIEQQVLGVLSILDAELREGAIVSVDFDAARVRILPLR
jgi:predicted nuclease of predicted toxin-antitoxin system